MYDAARILDCLAMGYRIDLSDAEYLRALLEVATPLFDRGLGALAYTYDTREGSSPVIDQFETSPGFDRGWLPPFYDAVAQADLEGGPERPAGFRAWGQLSSGQASRVPGMRPYLPLFGHLGGAVDSFAINALDASGRGLWIGAPLPTTERIPSELMTLCARLAAHLTAALRLRRSARPNAESAAAVLSPSGELLHARAESNISEARHELREAAKAFEQARTKAMRADVERATRRWRPLVRAQWTLLDEFDAAGRRIVIAAENAPPTRAPRRDLSEREIQVLTHAHLGHSPKEIAYELGLADSTVRVLLHRAAAKLGASSRKEALARFEALLASGTTDGNEEK